MKKDKPQTKSKGLPVRKGKGIRDPTDLVRRGWDDRYEIYVFTAKEWALTLAMAAVWVALVAWLFYKSVYAMVLLIPFCPVYVKRKRKKKQEMRKAKLRDQFKECLQSVAGALQAGMSMENAWKDAEKDMVRFLGKDADMTKELIRMNRRVACNEPLEKLMLEFSERSGIEDVQSFCQIFQFAKRGGGDLNSIIQNTYLRIADKVELEREIETAMAAKKMEQKIMSIMPLMILLYIGFTSSEFLAALYGNLTGVIVMTVCLVLYLLSIRLGEKIVRIEI
jgi:tight adherence protein B